MNADLENTLIEALDLLEQGTSVATILARYPEMAEELRPFLITAADLNQAAASPTAAQAAASKQAFLTQAAELQESRRQPVTAVLRRVLLSGLALIALLFVSGAMLATLATTALPGDTLYGAKLVVEDTRLNYSADPAAAEALIETFRRERIDEVARLLALGRRETVTLDGVIAEISADRWVVEGIPVVISPATDVRGEVAAGYLVEISGETGDGVLVASRVDVVGGGPPTPDLTVPQPPDEPRTTPTPVPDINDTPRPPAVLPPEEQPTAAEPTPTPPPPLSTEEEHADGDDVAPESSATEAPQDSAGQPPDEEAPDEASSETEDAGDSGADGGGEAHEDEGEKPEDAGDSEEADHGEEPEEEEQREDRPEGGQEDEPEDEAAVGTLL